MSTACGIRACRLTFVALLMTVVGCASGVWPWKPVVENAAPERRQRERELIDDFSQRRDNAQYQAALQSWESGDPNGCRDLIEKVLERNPEHREARQLLADLHLNDGDLNAAKEILVELLTEFPDDPQVHHSLGMLYEGMNEPDASLRHLSRAVELDPENELYRMCYETTLVTQDRPR